MMGYFVLDNTKVICAVCGREFSRITHKHLTTHDLTIEQYQQRFPESLLISPATSLRMRQASGNSNASRKGQPRSAETRAKIAATKAANPRPAWNRGKELSQEHRDTLSQIKREQYATGEVTHWNLGGRHSDVTKQKISEALKARHPSRDVVHHEEIIHNELSVLSTALGSHDLSANDPQIEKRIAAALRHHQVALDNGLQIIALSNRTYTLKCNVCNATFNLTQQYLRPEKITHRSIGFCPSCHPRALKTSRGERELADFISTIVPIERNNRGALGGKELDIYIPHLNIGIEYTGSFWHSEQMHQNKHNLFDKMELANNYGVRVIFVFEDEWRDNTTLVQSRLRQILGAQRQRLHGRACKIKPINSREAREFLQMNHIQGEDRASCYIGAYHDNTLVAVMSFKPTNFVKGRRGDQIELSRFAVKQGLTIPGMAGRLFAAYTRANAHVDAIISYSDNRWNTGAVYGAIGFERQGVTPPSYWYIKPGDYRRVHRSRFMKHVLVNQGYDVGKTEKQIMDERGFLRLWDCGTTVWKWHRKK